MSLVAVVVAPETPVATATIPRQTATVVLSRELVKLLIVPIVEPPDAVIGYQDVYVDIYYD